MKQYVYLLRDGNGNVVDVGESKSPKDRLYSKTKRKPGPGHGKFYGRTDITLEVLKGYDDRKEARQEEKRLQKLYNLTRYEDKAFREVNLKARKLTREQAEEVKKLYIPGKTTLSGIAKQYGVTRGVITGIVKGYTYKEDDYGYV